jgi:hypothetical protein
VDLVSERHFSHGPARFKAVGVRPYVAGTMEYWRNLKAAIFDFYRPERHYMRGPGPKCRAKHGTPLTR